MPARLTIAAVAILAGLTACVSPIAYATKEAVPLAYVGAVSFGKPVVRGGHTVVPLTIDYRSGKWLMNSAVTLYGTTATMHGTKIEFTVLTSLVSNQNVVSELRLPKLASGDYLVSYVDPDGTAHALGTITIQE